MEVQREAQTTLLDLETAMVQVLGLESALVLELTSGQSALLSFPILRRHEGPEDQAGVLDE